MPNIIWRGLVQSLTPQMAYGWTLLQTSTTRYTFYTFYSVESNGINPTLLGYHCCYCHSVIIRSLDVWPKGSAIDNLDNLDCVLIHC